MPSNENYGTNCDNLDILIKGLSEIAEEVGLENVDPVGITEVLESHFQPMSNEGIYDLAQQGKCQGITSQDGARPSLIQLLCCSVYCLF